MLEQKDPAKLFKQFRNGGLAFIKSLEAGKASESEILDFKLAKNADGQLETEDKANLARALSGFANTKGGLLVWGIYCAEDKDGEDCVQSFKPIAKIASFKSGLQSSISQMTLPPVQGVEHLTIIENEQNASGYLVVYIPPSSVPIESVFKKCKGFYERAGTSFVEMTGNRLVEKAKHRPLGKVLAPYMRAWAMYVAVMVVLVFGLFFGWHLGHDKAYSDGYAAGKNDALRESTKQASGERR